MRVGYGDGVITLAAVEVAPLAAQLYGLALMWADHAPEKERQSFF
ncbi:hypothetical protein [Gordonia sp. NPDC003376]